MVAVDDRILEYLNENEFGTPAEMQEGGPIYYSASYVAERCRELEQNGLVEDVVDAVYQITEDGEAYLQGRLDTETWECHDREEGAAGSS